MKRHVLYILIVLLATHPVLPQNAHNNAQKAKFIINFTLFTNWPQDSLHNPQDTLLIGVVGENAMIAQLKDEISGRAFKGMPMKVTAVKTLKNIKQLQGLRVLYIDSIEAGNVQAIVDYTRDKPILTVSNHKNCKTSDAIINMDFESEKAGYIINKQAAERSGLKFKYQLYQQGKIVNPVNN